MAVFNSYIILIIVLGGVFDIKTSLALALGISLINMLNLLFRDSIINIKKVTVFSSAAYLICEVFRIYVQDVYYNNLYIMIIIISFLYLRESERKKIIYFNLKIVLTVIVISLIKTLLKDCNPFFQYEISGVFIYLIIFWIIEAVKRGDKSADTSNNYKFSRE